MKKYLRMMTMLAGGAMVLQFGGCAANLLSNLFFAVGPLLL